MLKKSVPYLLSLLFFMLLACLYSSPVFSGKGLNMHDQNQAIAAAKELKDFHDATGEWAWWTNSMFGGMPAFMITGGYSYSLISNVGTFLYNLLPIPVYLLFILMAGFYTLMLAQQKNKYISVIASVAFAFGTYNLLFLEAGHISKVIAIAFAPAVIAGFTLIFRGKYLLGTLVSALFLGLELYANHLQITYYLFIILLLYCVFKFITLGVKKDFNAIKNSLIALSIATLIGVGSHGQRLWSGIVYAKESTRGASDLTQTKTGKEGLDMDYAFNWSYGKAETFNLMIPNLMGGGSMGELSKESDTYKALTSRGVDANMASQFIKQLPLYFGTQPITSGPAYSGIIVIFLFILGLFITKGYFKWELAGLTLFFILLSWGNNFLGFNSFMFNYFPGYNKFRAVTMILVMVHLLLVWGASNTLKTLFDKDFKLKSIKMPLIQTLAVIAGLMVFAYSLVSFNGPNDSGLKASLEQGLGADNANAVLNALRDDRATMATTDILRGLILLLLTSGLIYLYKAKEFKKSYLGLGLLLLVMFDLIGVDKRYFNNDDFVNKSVLKSEITPSLADNQILADKDPNFRVVNTASSIFSDATSSYFHKSIGGYHGAKLKRYGELIEMQMIKDGQLNMPILNMLNTKYFIGQAQNGELVSQLNPNAYGNAWTVDTLLAVNNADEQIAALSEHDLTKNAIIVGEQNKTFAKDSTDQLVLVSYKPNELLYEYATKNEAYVVFSEIYYRGNKDWKAYIDGKFVEHDNVNFVLRGLKVPAGKHQVKFEFKPESVSKGKYIDLISSIGLVLLIGATLYKKFKP